MVGWEKYRYPKNVKDVNQAVSLANEEFLSPISRHETVGENKECLTGKEFDYKQMNSRTTLGHESKKGNRCRILLFGLFLTCLAYVLLLIFLFFRDRRVFWLWIFSPLVWLVSIQYSPVLPASFFVLLMYIAFVKWESTKKRVYFIVSALSGGLTFALYEPSILILALFVLVFFYKKSLLAAFSFVLLTIPAFLLRIASDYFVTGFPLYSLVRYFGTNLAVAFGLNPGTRGLLHGLSSTSTLYSLFIICPLIFMFFRVDFSKNKRLLLFVLLSGLFFFLRSAYSKYFLLIAPLIFVLLAPVMSRRLLVFNSIVSVVLIVVFSQGYFASDPSEVMARDMGLISRDYPSTHYIDLADVPLYLWDEKYQFYSIYEYLHSIGKLNYSDYHLVVENKEVNFYQILELRAVLKPNYGGDIYTAPFIVKKGDKPLEGFKLEDCYEYLCVYKK